MISELIKYLEHALFMTVLESFPIFLSSMFFTWTFWGIPLSVYKNKIIYYAVFSSISLELLDPMVPYFAHLFSELIVLFVYMIILFPRFPWAKKIKTYIFLISTILVSLGSINGILLFFIDLNEIDHNLWLLAPGAWIPGIVLMIVNYILYKKNIAPGRSIQQWFKFHNNQFISLLHFFQFSQIILLSVLISVRIYYNQVFPWWMMYMLYFVVSISIVVFYLAQRAISKTKEDAVQSTQSLYVDEVNRLFATIRSQRHDFLNHVQVIHSFVKMNKQKELIDYTQELMGEIKIINEIIQIGIPALAALIQSKIVQAAEQNIEFTYQIDSLKEMPPHIKQIDLVKIVANLLDNAFDEAVKHDKENRWVELKYWKDQGQLWISVQNSGKVITSNEIPRLFEPGYTTKSTSEHSGLGLFIINESVNYYKGSVSLTSTQKSGVCITLNIPLSM
ncbi:MAG: hypothetical protein A2189_07155 [Paenibacillus sp. RIFOXYA1_FULL_44_5]|nr:MAG: hypothetical protein A2189_07155 [Paenibacillus sp. RIFOXYA1_FULL_44_5]